MTGREKCRDPLWAGSSQHSLGLCEEVVLSKGRVDKEKTCYWPNNWHILKVSDGKEKFVTFQACFTLHLLSLIPHEFMYFQTTSEKYFCIIPKVLCIYM